MFAITPRFSDDFDMFGFPDELGRPMPMSAMSRMPMPMIRNAAGRESEVQNTDKEFRIRLDLGHFRPEEVKITSDHHRVRIHAKHEEKQDHHGHSYVSREITRVYKLPEDVDPTSVTSAMNTHGVLNIKAAKKALEAPRETPIPIEFQQ